MFDINTRPTKNKKVLLASFESEPFINESLLSKGAYELCQKSIANNSDMRIILPKLNSIAPEYINKMQYMCNFIVPLSWRRIECKLYKLRKSIKVSVNGELKSKQITHYFIENDYIFNRENVYGESDDAERMAFFSKAVLEALIHIHKNYNPDYIFCNGAPSSLTPVFLKEHYKELFNNTRTIMFRYDSDEPVNVEGYSKNVIGDILGLSECTKILNQIRMGCRISYIDCGREYADEIIHVTED